MGQCAVCATPWTVGSWDDEDALYFYATLAYLESKRGKYLALKKWNDPKAMDEFRKMKQALPTSFLQKRTLTLNYETLLNICSRGQRRHHRLKEWSDDFMSWARTLPNAQEFIFFDEMEIGK